jgi:dCMP deaminase
MVLRNEKWDNRFLRMAREIASWSKDPSAKIGAVAVKDRRILSTGYNGFPAGIDDDPIRYQDRETKYQFVVHAEMNAIYNAGRNGIPLQGSTMYVYGLPACHECAKGIASAGIKRVVCCFDDEHQHDKWFKSYEKTLALFAESGIIVHVLPIKEIDNEFDG